MASAELPPMTFADGGLRISLFPPSDGPASPTSPVPHLPYAELDGHYDDDDDDDDDDGGGSYGHSHRQSQRHSQGTSYRYSHQSHHHQPSPEQQNNIPEHPIPSLQDAFAESLHEVTTGSTAKPKLKELDAKARRELLLSQDSNDEPYDAIWRHRPGQHEHEVFKLVSQISFGVYLLLNGMANSNVQVVNILQGHIDEVDEFLEVVLEDLTQAAKDLTGRIEHLQLPLTNIKVFEELLEDRKFRAEILAGNEKIEHILARTNAVMKEWDDDIESGLSCTAAFTSWLGDQREGTWRTEQPDLVDIFNAMEGNVDGWLNAFDDMNDKAQDINSLIIRLMTIVAEMEKKAGEVSRRTWVSRFEPDKGSSQGNAPDQSSQAKIPPYSKPTPTLHGGGSSMSSPPSSFGSRSRSMHQASLSGGSASTAQPTTSVESIHEDDNVDSFDFPLPGGLPLLPPTSSPLRANPRSNPLTPKPRTDAGPRSSPEDDRRASHARGAQSNSSSKWGPSFVLQPRTYSPQPSTPSQSPMLREAPSFAVQPPKGQQQEQRQPQGQSSNGLLVKKPSLRQRISLKTNPPESIHIPPRSIKDVPQRPSPGHITPRTSSPQLRDSAYGSDADSHFRNHGSRGGSNARGMTPPPARPGLMPSPHSDQNHQYYRPVRASPHSPLQQRPHTAAGPSRPHTHAQSHSPHQHLRNQPSHLGGMSTLSNVTLATYDDRSVSSMTATSAAGTAASVRTGMGTQKGLKKKKSAFGWFKKAFSMDEEERRAFEERKTMGHQERYYEGGSPRFLDGRRVG